MQTTTAYKLKRPKRDAYKPRNIGLKESICCECPYSKPICGSKPCNHYKKRWEEIRKEMKEKKDGTT